MSKKAQKRTAGKPPFYGLMAEYDSPRALIEASKQVRDAQYRNWDTYAPFPVHGIDPAMGIKPTILPWIVLVAGAAGCALGLWMQWWTNGVDYPWITSGKPFFGIPAAIPVAFEFTVLFSALTALGAMLALNRLPHPSHALDLCKRFARVTDDRFFLVIEASDPKYDDVATRALLKGTAPLTLDEVADDNTTSARIPRGVLYGLAILVVTALIPLALGAFARATTGENTRVHLVKNMDQQDYQRAQATNGFFEDDRADRSQLAGTIAVGHLDENDHFFRGKVDGQYAATFPAEVELTEATMERGQQRFDIYCAPCHGVAGQGNGLVSERALGLMEGTWIPATNVRQGYLMKQPVGQLFEAITKGVRNMPGYGSLVPPADRWAIILYLRALQRSQNAAVTDVPASETLP